MFSECLYKIIAEKSYRVSKLESELSCKNYLLEKIKQKLAGEVRTESSNPSLHRYIDHPQVGQQSILALIDETKPRPASVITEISDFARKSHFNAGSENLRQGRNYQTQN